MRSLRCLLLLAPLLALPLLRGAEPTLRQGHAQSPEEAREELNTIRNAVPDLDSWEQRQKKLRQGLLEGARLTKLPDRSSSRVR